MSRCPSSEQLEAFLDESLAPSAQEALSAHVARCQRCQLALEKMTAESALMESVSVHSRPPSDSAIQAKAEMASFLASLGQAPPSLGHANGASVVTPPAIPGYEILGKLGRGGMAVVYRARHLKLDRVVALKMVLAGAEIEPRSRKRFLAEAEAVARLHHPGIVQIYDVGESAGCPYLALEYMSGGSLADWIDGTPQPIDGTVELLEMIARAVHFAHEHQIIHRDLKPANILLTRTPAVGPLFRDRGPEPVAKITDFGLAKRLDRDGSPTQSGEMIGTPSYMAPEQAHEGSPSLPRGISVGPATDVYALGAVLYEMLTGRPPLKGATPLDTVLQVWHQDPVRPSSLRPGLPRDLETICLKCLDKDPRKRYATAERLADDLHRFRRGQPIQARPVRAVERLIKWARRRPGYAALLAAMLGVTVLGFAGVTWQWLQTRSEKQNVELEKQNVELARGREAAERRRASDALYFSRIVQSQLQFRANDVAGASVSLAACVPQSGHQDRRGWEWYYLSAQLHRDLWTLPLAHAGTSGNVVVGPHGRRVAAVVDGVGEDSVTSSAIRIWDARNGAVLKTFTGPPGVHRLILHPDGRRLILGTTDGSVLIWDADSGKELLRFRPHDAAITALALRPDGRQVASSSWDHTVKVWDLATGRVRHTFRGHTDRVQAVAWHPDGRRLASGGWDHMVKVWDIGLVRVQTLKAHRSPVYCIQFSPDGKLLVSAGSNGNFRLWNLASGASTPPMQSVTSNAGAVLGFSFSPDSRSLAYGSTDATVRVWDIESGVEDMLFRGHRAPVESVAFSPDGARLVSFSPVQGAVKFWDMTRHPQYANFAWTGADVEALALSPDGQHALCLTTAGHLQSWQIRASMLEADILVPVHTEANSPGVAAAFNATGTQLAGRSQDDPRQVRIWAVAGGKEMRRLLRLSAGIACVKFSSDSNLLAACACDTRTPGAPHEIKIWDTASGAERFALTGRGRIFNLAFSPDARWLAATGENGLLRLVHLADQQTLTLPEGHSGNVTAVAFSPNGQYLAAAGTEDQAVKVWRVGPEEDELNWRLVNTLPSPGFLGDVAFSPDSKRLAGVSRDVVKMWEVATGHEVLTLWGASQRYWDPPFNPRLLFSANGNQLMASNWNESISIWHAGRQTGQAAVQTRQAKRRQAAEERAGPWHLREAQQCLEHQNVVGLRFHLQWIDPTHLSEPLRQRYRELQSHVPAKKLRD